MLAEHVPIDTIELFNEVWSMLYWLLLVLDDEVGHGASAIQPLLEVQRDGGAAHLDEVSRARHGGLGTARACDHHVWSLAGADAGNVTSYQYFCLVSLIAI